LLKAIRFSKNKFRIILRRFSDRSNYQEFKNLLGVRLSTVADLEFGIAAEKQTRCVTFH
jgi:hypothetical protein